MFVQSDAIPTVNTTAQEETRPQNRRLSYDRQEQALVNLGAVALLLTVSLVGGLAIWSFLPIG
ncbi:MAG: hypothetical protein AAGM67_09445 [Bacteroidota bacterium]